jgi:hypothetical protein
VAPLALTLAMAQALASELLAGVSPLQKPSALPLASASALALRGVV